MIRAIRLRAAVAALRWALRLMPLEVSKIMLAVFISDQLGPQMLAEVQKLKGENEG